MVRKKISRGVRNNNPFNIRISRNRWIGKAGFNTDGTFEQFTLMEYGIRAGLIILRTYINKYHLHSIDGIVARFAPEKENDLKSYTDFIKHRFDGFDFDYNYIVVGSEEYFALAWSMMIFESNFTISWQKLKDIYNKYLV